MQVASVFLFGLLLNFSLALTALRYPRESPTGTREYGQMLWTKLVSCANEEIISDWQECAAANGKASLFKESGCKEKSGNEMKICIRREMLAYSESVVDCVLQKNKMMDSTKQIDFDAFKPWAIDSSSLDDEQKKAAKATFDVCMLTKSTPTFSFFTFEPKGNPAALHALIAKIIENSNGNEKLSELMSVIDCMLSAVIQNGCSTLTNEEADDILKLMSLYDEKISQ